MTKLQTPRWLDPLKRRFSPSRLRLGLDGAAPLPGGGAAGLLALVGRELCLFLVVDARRVPAAQRQAFVAMAVRRAAPFPDPESDVLWVGDHAAVWYWSRERARAISGGGRPVRHRAEALFRGNLPSGDAEQLLVLDVTTATGERFTAGVEARVWRNGRLQASRWWPQVPDPDAWAAFARGAGLSAMHPVPDAEPALIRDTPLEATHRGLALRGQFEHQLPMVAGLLGVAFLALLAWQAAGAARAAAATRAVEGEIAMLSTRLERIIAARERADAAQARIDALLALRTPTTQTRLLGEVAQLTPGAWEMLAWHLPGPDMLEVSFRMPNPDVATIVAAWEASPLLQEASPAPNARPAEVALQARLTPLREQP